MRRYFHNVHKEMATNRTTERGALILRRSDQMFVLKWEDNEIHQTQKPVTQLICGDGFLGLDRD